MNAEVCLKKESYRPLLPWVGRLSLCLSWAIRLLVSSSHVSKHRHTRRVIITRETFQISLPLISPYTTCRDGCVSPLAPPKPNSTPSPRVSACTRTSIINGELMTHGNTYLLSVSASVRSSFHASIYPSSHSSFLPTFPSSIDSSTYSSFISFSLPLSRTFIHLFTDHSTYIPYSIYPFIHSFIYLSFIHLLIFLSIFVLFVCAFCLYALFHPRKKKIL